MGDDSVSLREWVQVQLDLRDRAHTLQAQELERRLELANDAIKRADAERSRVVSRELFDKTIQDMTAQREQLLAGINDRLGRLRTWADTISGGLMLLRIGGISGIVAFILFLLHAAGITK